MEVVLVILNYPKLSQKLSSWKQYKFIISQFLWIGDLGTALLGLLHMVSQKAVIKMLAKARGYLNTPLERIYFQASLSGYW